MDETDVKINGRWAYLYRAVDRKGHTGFWVKFSTTGRRSRSRA
ncbi:MAG: DDE-type integrase/transposase/recombinase [Serratia symbiotica]|nr:DDE-type integrase/transposase/recombinase [Serratia symbiotica]